MKHFNSNLIAVVLTLSTLQVGQGEETTTPKFCSKRDFGSDEEYYNCVKLRRWKRHYRQGGPENPCTGYVSLTNLNRRVGNIINSTSSPLCDRNIALMWYRFGGNAGGKIPESCPPSYSCGTVSPIWMKDPHPTSPYAETIRTVCVSGDNCCEMSWGIKVVNCINFFVYQLISPPRCYMSYCAGEEKPCPDGTNSMTGFTPDCSDNFPVLTGKAKLDVSHEEPSIKFYCDYRGRIPSGAILLIDWFVAGDKSTDRNGNEVPIWTDEAMERKRSVLTEGRWAAKMGSTIFCHIRSKWKNNTGVISKPIESTKYFAGIKILNRVVNVSESGTTAQIQLQSTVPIKCLPEFEDNCKIVVEVDYNPGHADDLRYLDYSHDQQIVFGDCSVEINSENWEQVHNITVKAVRDFRRDGNKRMLVSFKPIFTTVASYMWNEYRLPNVEVISSDAKTGVCLSYGDPHLVTFDGLQYHIYVEGEFVLYQNTKYQMKIHVRLEKCTDTATCNCGLAVAVNDDIIVVDRCHRRQRYVASGESFPEGWNTLHRHALEQGASFVRGLRIFEHNEGRKYTIHTPSGSYVDFDIGDKWVRIDFYASSDDYNSTLGLCGTFDENITNEFTLRDGINQLKAVRDAACGDDANVCNFLKSWRVPPEESLFGDKVNLTWDGARIFKDEKFCTCTQKGLSSEINCDYHKDVINLASKNEQEDGVDKTGTAVIHPRGSRPRRGVDDNEYDDYFNSEFLYDENFHGHLLDWPTPSGITQASAEKSCRTYLFNNQAGTNCYELFNESERTKFVQSCATDIKMSDSYDWIKSSLEPFISQCVNRIYTNATMWLAISDQRQSSSRINVTETNTEAHHLLRDICPNSCWQKGNCVNRRCICHAGHEGVDCSINSSTIPQNLRISGRRICDIRKSECNNVMIIGNNFLKKDFIICNFVENEGTHVNTSSEFMTFEEISCPSPPITAPFHKFTLNIVIEDKSFTRSLGEFAIFDSKCTYCESSEAQVDCFFKDNTCSINGQCYEEFDANPDNCCEICSPESSRNSFVTRVLPTFNLEPEEGTIEFESCDVTGRKLTQVSPKFDCNFRFEVKWFDETCSSLLGFSNKENSVFAAVKRCKEATCSFIIEASTECSNEIIVKEYTIRIPGGTFGEMEPCGGNTVEVMNGTAIQWNVSSGGIRRMDFSNQHQLEGPVNYSIIKGSPDDISISSSGEITYLAPSRLVNEQIIVLVEKECLKKVYTQISINVQNETF